MANIENSCSHLQIKDVYSELAAKNEINNWLLWLVLEQEIRQNSTYAFDFTNKANITPTKPQELSLEKMLLLNLHAFADEVNEFVDACGGISDGDGSAVWKHWKAKNNSYHIKTINDLSDKDLLELKFELIDMLKFWLIFFVSLGGGVVPTFIDRVCWSTTSHHECFFGSIVHKNKSTDKDAVLSLNDLALLGMELKLYVYENYWKFNAYLNKKLSEKKLYEFLIEVVEMIIALAKLCGFANVGELINMFVAKSVENVNRKTNNY